MAVKAHPDPEKLTDHDGPSERGYVSWKRAKVETGLEQSKDRNKLIPAEKVWHDLGLEH